MGRSRIPARHHYAHKHQVQSTILLSRPTTKMISHTERIRFDTTQFITSLPQHDLPSLLLLYHLLSRQLTYLSEEDNSTQSKLQSGLRRSSSQSTCCANFNSDPYKEPNFKFELSCFYNVYVSSIGCSDTVQGAKIAVGSTWSEPLRGCDTGGVVYKIEKKQGDSKVMQFEAGVGAAKSNMQHLV